jgi:hypothetical protein
MEDKMSEKCQRCGEEGEDRRTLFHSCFYDMDELHIPFEKDVLFLAEKDKLDIKKKPIKISAGGGKELVLQSATYTTKGELNPREFFTLRVCKRCRGEWLAVIKEWFFKEPEQTEGCGSGIFIRRNGISVEITEDEWYRLQAERDSKR